MTLRRSSSMAAAIFALAWSALTLAGCAHKHQRTATAPAPAQIRSGETGLASWYGHPYHGRPAANGEIYDMEGFTAAHRTLPFGTRVRVVNLTNDKTVDPSSKTASSIFRTPPPEPSDSSDREWRASASTSFRSPAPPPPKVGMPSKPARSWNRTVPSACAPRSNTNMDPPGSWSVPAVPRCGEYWWDGHPPKQPPMFWPSAFARRKGPHSWCGLIRRIRRFTSAPTRSTKAIPPNEVVPIPQMIWQSNAVGCCRNPKVPVEFMKDEDTLFSDSSNWELLLNASAS
jgi:hypothetical protein